MMKLILRMAMGLAAFFSLNDLQAQELVRDLNPDGDSNPRSMLVGGDAMYFEADLDGVKIVKYDGNDFLTIDLLNADGLGGFQWIIIDASIIFQDEPYYFIQTSADKFLVRINSDDVPEIVANIGYTENPRVIEFQGHIVWFDNGRKGLNTPAIVRATIWTYDGLNPPKIETLLREETNRGYLYGNIRVAEYAEKLFFFFDQRSNRGQPALWSFSFNDGVTFVDDLDEPGSPIDLIALGDLLYISGHRLLVYDGENPPRKVFHENTFFPVNVRDMTVYDGKLYFESLFTSDDKGIWSINSSQESKVLRFDGKEVRDVKGAGAARYKNALVGYGAELCGNRLGKIACFSEGGYSEFTDHDTSGGWYLPNNLAVFGDDLYFSGFSPDTGFELWKYSHIVNEIPETKETPESRIRIDGPFPNPSAQSSSLEIQSLEEQEIKIKIYDVSGRYLLTLSEMKYFEFQKESFEIPRFDAKGVIFIELIGEKSREIRKVIFL